MGRLTRESEAGGLTLAYAYDSSGNRTSMTASGTESYTINYSYDANNRLTSSVYADGTHASTYAYDAAGNLLTAQEWKPQEGIASTASYSYNNLNQLASQTVNGRSSSFAYNADGIRTAKAVGRRLVGYLLDGGNVIGETEGGELVATYQRGVNLISCIDPRDTNFEETYYLYNAHGDVTGLTDEYGNLTKTYEYDAFGNEKNRTSDPNPFRYCGEYYDAESGSYYLRARYYNPSVGRFTQEDTHWNTGNMIYGDEPQQIGEYKDPLGVSRCTYAPNTLAIAQSGNRYGYCINNPLSYSDPEGEALINAVFAAIGALGGWAFGDHIAKGLGLEGWKYWAVRSAVTIGGAAIGWFAGSAISALAKSFLTANPAVLAKMPSFVLKFLGLEQLAQSAAKTVEMATKTLYRAMSFAEYDALCRMGKFSSIDGTMASKWFAMTFQDAQAWASKLYAGGEYVIVKIKVPADVVAKWFHMDKLDAIGPAVCAELEELLKYVIEYFRVY